VLAWQRGVSSPRQASPRDKVTSGPHIHGCTRCVDLAPVRTEWHDPAMLRVHEASFSLLRCAGRRAGVHASRSAASALKGRIMTFEYLTPEEVANFTPEQAEWEEAALKREAAMDDLSDRLKKLAQRQRAMAARLRAWDEDAPRPQLVLIRGEKDDDA
jgi:hypothetical protein